MDISDIFKLYRKKRDINEISISQMKADLGDSINKIVLYGAGSAGIAFLHYLQDVNIFPCFFADGNPEKWGKKCEGITIIDYKEIVERVGKDALVIVTINTDGVKYCKSFEESLRIGGHSGVHKNLKTAGCDKVIDYTYFRRCYKLFQGDKYNLPSCSDVYLMERHEEDIKSAYGLLADDYSREVFEKILYFRMIDDTIKIPTEPQIKQYFEYNFFSPEVDEVFVDCGAFNGISLKTFLQENENKFKKYYGLEPDEKNYEKLCNYVAELSETIKRKIILKQVAAYDSEKSMKFYALQGPGSFITDIGTCIVNTDTIDNVVKGEKVSFIKMNIEGSELQALNGAKETIKRNMPRLAIAGYHKTWDLWEIPLLIHKMGTKYRFYLRSYMNNLSFVFYAVK